jgi:hypothetical protein
MKKVVVALMLLSCLGALILSAKVPGVPLAFNDKSSGKSCRGYTIIEVDKGINCKGDTIKLTRKNGFYEEVQSLNK